MSEKYDVIIIGAGIGGLTCGCYLAKAGLKVLIVEQHNKPGGYCTSFEREGYKFDAGVHFLSGLKNNWLNTIFQELGIRNEIIFKQFDPSDKIIMPEQIVYIRSRVEDTIQELKKSFPTERKNIEKLFRFMLNRDFISIYSKTKKMNFSEILDNFLKDYKLKSIFEVLLGNIGLCSDKTSAVSGVLLFRNFITDPGWYPRGGIQVIPDTMVKLLKKHHGNILFLKKVVKILIENHKAAGVILDDGTLIRSKAVVSNADATQTFKKLLDLKSREETRIEKLEISPSIFCVYLGLREDFKNLMKETSSLWYFSTYNIKDCYSNFDKVLTTGVKPKYFVCAFPFLHNNFYNKPTMEIFFAAHFKSLKFWGSNRDKLMEELIGRAGDVIPNLRNYIELKFNATPRTLYNYTLNRDGAAYGWASTSNLIMRPACLSKTSIQNLYLAGHWCNGGLSQGGIPQVAVVGRTAARSLMETVGLKWDYKHSFLV